MKSHAIELQKQYDQLAEAAKTQINEIMGSLSEGGIPDQASLDNLEASFSAMRKKEGEFGVLAEVDPDLPEKRRQVAKILLKRFARIKSPVRGYKKALAPYQRQALELLPSVDNCTEILDIERLTTGPRLFFRALETIEKYPNFGYSLQKALEGFYPERVLLGIIGRKYFLAAEDTENARGDAIEDAIEQENRELEELGYDPAFVIQDDVLMEYTDKESEGVILIPPWVRRIKGLAFNGCREVRRIMIPDSVQEIGYCAFHNAGIVSIVIPDSVTELGSEAFSYCSRLKSAVIGKGIKEVERRTFEYCQELDHLELPATLKDVDTYAFEKCYSLKSAWVDGKEYRLRDPDAPKPVKLVYESLERIRDRIQSDYDNGLMDEFEYIDYNIAGDGYSY